MMRPLICSLLLTTLATTAQAMSPVADEQLADETGQAGLTVNIVSPGITASSITLQDDGNNLQLGTLAWQSLNGSGTPGGQFKYALTLDAGTATASPTNPELRLSINQALSRQRFSITSLSMGNGIDAGTAALDFEGSVNLLARAQLGYSYVLSGSLNFTPTNTRFSFKDGDASPNGGATLYYSDLSLALALGRAEFNLVNNNSCGTMTGTGLCVTLPSSYANKLDLTIGNLAILDNAATSAPASTDRAWAGTVNLDINNAWWLVQGQGNVGTQGIRVDGYVKFNSNSGLTFYDAAAGTDTRSYGFRQLQGSLTMNDATLDVTSSGLNVRMPDMRSSNDADTLRFNSMEIGGTKFGSMEFRNFQSSLELTLSGH